ncbi:phosphoenolpyruvate carboxylase [Tessaracoccus caeni]|uniref:phosphoenolpyruvate carboxylase n=1 Tax=Tessaracoccus caeni TaxID=3031239 RepID=UPI0023DBCC68|nr:phosphoenolpyruvate carboxylase [Tessaracoccus caeni]MDF1489107.1 phosphoenolpyruvate carboxylase [Tessaracoccus caeni]
MPDINTTPMPAESSAITVSELSDQLRADVRLLTTLLGQVLKEGGSAGLFDDVEALRQASVAAHRDVTPEALSKAIEIAESFSVERADEVARAFTVYFHLVNLAEEFQRIRMVREGDPEVEGATDTIPKAMACLREEIGEEAAQRRLERLRFHPVFTAHPTEARRRAVSTSIRRIARLLEEQVVAQGDQGSQRRIQRRLLEEIDTLWRTAPLRSTQPGPEDEVRSLMAIFDETLYLTIPRMYRYVDDALQGDEAGRRDPLVRPFMRLGSWVGGDRDGNPFVTPSVTIQAAAIASDHVLRGLEHTATAIARSITLDSHATPPTPALVSLWQNLSMADRDAAATTTISAPNEPHKQVMTLIARRIAATRNRNADLAYGDPEELIADLRTVQDSLRAAGALRQAYGTVQTLLWQVETFGFHLAELEVRQHSAVHAKALAECEAGGPRSPETESVLEVFRAMAQIQRRYGPRAAGRYIVSFTQSAADLAAVRKLAKYSGADVVLDVIPLFETFADLQGARAILAEAVTYPEFAARLEQTGGKLEVMLGYSDSSKDVGPVAANLALYDAQVAISQWAIENGLELTLFHGRGGALGRGGGPTNTAILAQPPHSVNGRFKLTEQGEVIFARYGDPTIAMRHIDQVAAATLLAVAPSVQRRNVAAAEKYAAIAQKLSTASRSRFDSLVQADGFAPWFATVTPMEEIGRLQLGSRPARRGLSVESLADLRAIPWVFAWSQARINLAGWFGLGSALDAVGDVEQLREAYEEWPLFRAMIDNVGMSLAKADARIARRYLELGDRPDFTELVLDEMELTRSWLIRIVGGDALLANRPALSTAVDLRAPYVDVLSLLQLRALRVLRSDAAEQIGKEWEHLLLLSVSGVSAGLQNTG